MNKSIFFDDVPQAYYIASNNTSNVGKAPMYASDVNMIPYARKSA